MHTQKHFLYGCIVFAAVALLVSTCNSPTPPWNDPEYVEIEMTTSGSVDTRQSRPGDTIEVELAVALPNLVGSVEVDFGDGTEPVVVTLGSKAHDDTLLTLKHRYGKAGTYEIVATAHVSGDGSDRTCTTEILVGAPPRFPEGGELSEIGTPVIDSAFGYWAKCEGTDSLSYTWFKDGDQVAEAFSDTLYFDVLAPADSGVYLCIASSIWGADTSRPDTLEPVYSLSAPSVVGDPDSQTVMVGDTAVFVGSAEGTAVSHAWLRDGARISGAADTVLRVGPVSMDDDGAVFRFIVSNGAGGDSSRPALLTVSEEPVAPAITSSPDDQVVAEGDTATFAVAATGSDLLYQWQRNGVDIADGAGSASYTLAEVTVEDDSSSFRCIVSNGVGADTSDGALLLVSSGVVAPEVTGNPRDRHVAEGNSATFAVEATGTALKYQWQENGSDIADGADSASYTVGATSLDDDSTRYRCIVSNGTGADTSSEALLRVSAEAVPPSITADPQDRETTEGDTVSFTVVAEGTNLGYQWQKNGLDIATGGDSASYTIYGTVVDDDSSGYRCLVSNNAGADTSVSALLLVDPAVDAPSISVDPHDQQVTEGETATFTVTATGTDIHYQWQKDASDIAESADSAVYTTAAATLQDDSSEYRCVVSNSAGADTSAGALLLVSTSVIPPSISSHPQDQAVTEGETATFTVQAGGTDLHYQWQQGTSNIAGATSASYTTPAAVLSYDGTTYRCVVGNSADTVASNYATLTVNEQIVAPSITTHPSDVTVTEGETATFTVEATGADLQYQWQQGTTDISGATSSSYTTSATTLSNDGTTYQCVVSNSAGTVTSNAATLTVNQQIVAPSITTHPSDVTVTEGETATFTVEATGTDLQYQWQQGTTDISGATSSSYTTSATTLSNDGTTYQCVVSNSAGTVTSNAATLTVNQNVVAPSISTHPSDVTVTEGETATFTVEATGTDLQYQWQQGTTDISGATSSSYTTSATTLSDDGTTYQCVVSNSAGTVTSNAATLTVNQNVVAPSISTHPSDVTVTEGETATFTVEATGTDLQYQWQQGTTDMSGATSSSYTTAATALSDDGTTYQCVVSNSAGTVTSNAATLTVNQQVAAPSITTHPSDVSVTEGEAATFSVSAEGTDPQYQWQKDGGDVDGATSSSYTIASTQSSDDGSSYRCIVSNAAGADTSNAAQLSVTPPPQLIAHYPFDGNAEDATANGNHGTVSGAVLAADRNGAPDSAYYFDGVDDYIGVEDNTALRVSRDITVAAWVYLDGAQSQNVRIVMKERSVSSPQVSYGLVANWGDRGKFSFEIATDQNAQYSLESATSVASGEWFHVAGTYDGSTMKIYINGVEERSRTQNGNLTYSTWILNMGGDHPRNIEYLKGRVDDVRIHDGVLSATEIAELAGASQ